MTSGVELTEALRRVAEFDARAARVVELAQGSGVCTSDVSRDLGLEYAVTLGLLQRMVRRGLLTSCVRKIPGKCGPASRVWSSVSLKLSEECDGPNSSSHCAT